MIGAFACAVSVRADALQSSALPISTVGRLKDALARLGYAATVEVRSDPGGVRLVVSLRAADRIRYIFVEGNLWLRQDEIVRRISLRA